jgi:hypothetical protein
MQLVWYILLVLGITLVYGFVYSLCKTASDADDELMRDCCSCKKHSTMECPNSSECYSTEDKPQYTGGEDDGKEQD